MNLLFLTHQGDLSGATNSIVYLCKGLADKGHNVYIGCRRDSLIYELLKDTKVKVLEMTFKRKSDLQNMKEIRDVVLKYNIQLINAQSTIDRYTSILSKWIYKLPVKIIHTRRQVPKSVGGWLQNYFYVKGTEKIVAVSDELKNIFVRKGLPSNHMVVINNGTPKEKYDHIDPTIVNELKQKHDIKETDLVIGCVSRLKKQTQLIKALQYLPSNIKVIFVGINKEDLESELIKYDIKNEIIFAGTLDNFTSIHYNYLFTIAVLPSIDEGLSQSVLESMALGIPVIGTRYAGLISQIIEGESGLLYENDNIKDLSEKIKLLLDNEALRKRISDNGKSRALKFYSIENTINNYENLFYSLIK